MPQRVKSQKRLLLDTEKQLKDHARDVFSRTIGPVLSKRGYILSSYLDGEIDRKRSRKLREQLMDMRIDLDDEGIEKMESGAIPDLVLKDKNGKYVVLIEVMTTSTIEVRRRGLFKDIEEFAKVWEEERKNINIELPNGAVINKVVTIVEV